MALLQNKAGSPEKIIYEFDEATNEAFTETIGAIKEFKYSRYTPLGIMKQDRIVYFLDFLIRFHPQTSFSEAREKWRQDLKWTADYKANPERFLIAK